MKNIYRHISRALLVIGLFFLCEGVMWGSDSYYVKLTVGASSTGHGTAYAGTSSTGDFTEASVTSGDLGSSGSTTTLYGKASPDEGYHLVGWATSKSATTPDAGTSNPQGFTLTANTKNATTDYNRYAIFALSEYYAKLTATSGGNGTITVNTSSPQKGASGGSTVDFSITVTPNQYYHLEKIEFTTGSGTISSDNTKVTVAVSSGDNYGTDKAATYAIKATFARDTYTVVFDKNSSDATGTMSNQSFTSGENHNLPALGYVYDNIITYDAQGGTVNGQAIYYDKKTKFKQWDEYSGSTVVNTYPDKGQINKASTATVTLKANWTGNPKFTMPDASKGDRTLTGWHFSDGNKRGTVGTEWYPNGNFELFARYSDPFYASINLSKTSGTSGTPSADATLKSSDYKNKDLVFNISAPEPSDGYYFSGWTGTNVSFGSSSSLSTTATVKSSSSAGSASASVYDIKANYAPVSYSITIKANSTGSSSDDKIVFNVEGPNNYHLRISVAFGGSATLTNLSYGTYTVTPESSWNWNYTITPAEKKATFEKTSDPSQNILLEFNIGSKPNAKKHDELTTRVTY